MYSISKTILTASPPAGGIRELYRCFACREWTRNCAVRARRYVDGQVALIETTPCCKRCFGHGEFICATMRRGMEFEEYEAGIGGFGLRLVRSDTGQFVEECVLNDALELESSGDSESANALLGVLINATVFSCADPWIDEPQLVETRDLVWMQFLPAYSHVDLGWLRALSDSQFDQAAGPDLESEAGVRWMADEKEVKR